MKQFGEQEFSAKTNKLMTTFSREKLEYKILKPAAKHNWLGQFGSVTKSTGSWFVYSE